MSAMRPEAFLQRLWWLRLAITVVLVPAVWFVDASGPARAVATAGLLVHLVAGEVADAYGRRHSDFPVPVVVGPLGALCAFGLTLLGDDLRLLALLGYLTVVTYVAGVASRRTAYVVGLFTALLVAVREIFVDADDRLPAIVIVAFAICTMTVAAMVDALRTAATRSTRTLERVYDAMRTVTASPELGATLDSMVAAAERAVGAMNIAILLKETDHLVLAAPTNLMGEWWSPARVEAWTRADLEHGSASPVALTITRGQTVVVDDVLDTHRFPEWSAQFGNVFRQFGVRSLVSVPLIVGTDVIGGMQTLFSGPIPDADDTVQLLEVYGEQATLVIVRAQAYERERQLRARVAEADRLKSEFLALVSHELRTPLTATKGFVDTVVLQWEKLDDGRKRELLQRASANADELTKLIAQLLDYSRIEAATMALELRPVDVGEAVGRVLAQVAPVLERHAIVVDIERGISVQADADALAHVLANLLTNAAKFAEAGTTISIGGHRDDSEVLVTVADEGPGIPLEEQDLIFERFYQLPEHRAAYRPGGRGTGLGLAIARRYAQACGGRLWVESEPGAGATFVCALPPVPDGGRLTARPAPTKLDQPV